MKLKLNTCFKFTVMVFISIMPSITWAESAAEPEMRFPGDPTDHNVVFQFNKADSGLSQCRAVCSG